MQADPDSLKRLSPAVEKAVRDSFGELAHYATYADANLIFACAMAHQASDTVLQAPPNGLLTYVHGPVAYLGDARKISLVNHRDRPCLPDRRLVEVRAAVYASLDGRPGLEYLSGAPFW
jgi:hypothetical protein